MKVKDSVRTGDAQEAAGVGGLLQRPATTRERQATGTRRRSRIRYWQIGNETSYDKNGFDLETAARKTVEFAKAMRAADPAIQLIALGRQRLGGPHGGDRRRARRSTSRSITCSIPTRASGRCCAASCTGAIPTRRGSS